MTIEAETTVLAYAIVNTSFRERLLHGEVGLEELLGNNDFSGLDKEGAEAILAGATLNTTMPQLAGFIEGYQYARYKFLSGFFSKE